MFQNSKIENSFQTSNFSSEGARSQFLIVALFSAWVSILVTNFFGFSVVIIGLYFFLLPAFCFLFVRTDPPPEKAAAPVTFYKQPRSLLPVSNIRPPVSAGQYLACFLTLAACLYLLISVVNLWQADVAYALGKSYDSAQGYVEGYTYLNQAVDQNSAEPTYRDELSINEADLAAALYDKINTASIAALATASAEEKKNLKVPIDGQELSVSDLIEKAVRNSNIVAETSPKSLPFVKTRTRLFYTLSTIDSKYLFNALAAIQHAEQLAPTDAKVHYNLGLLQGRTGNASAAIKTFEETVLLKPDYRDAHFALGTYYKAAGDLSRARAQMQFILDKIGPDAAAQKFLQENKP